MVLHLLSVNLSHSLLYIDPGTGSIILQAIAATVVGAVLFVKYGLQRVLRFFGLRKEEKNEFSGDPEEKEEGGRA